MLMQEKLRNQKPDGCAFCITIPKSTKALKDELLQARKIEMQPV